MSGWQDVYQNLADDNFVLIAAAQDTGGEAVAREWYDQADATYVTLVDEAHVVSSLFGLGNVPSAVWIDETGNIRRIDEGTYATVHKMGDFEFGREDYAPMVTDWVRRGDESEHVQGAVSLDGLKDANASAALAAPTFKLGVYFHKQGDETRAEKYWTTAQSLHTENWNYHRQDWSFTPSEAGANWFKKFQTLGDKPYYAPMDLPQSEGQ